MSKKSSLMIELVLGLAISGVVAWGYFTRWEPIESFSLQTYDIYSRFNQTEPKVGDIEIVGIDDDSLLNIGRWPWPRPIVAQLVDEVANYGAKVIGLNIGYYDEDQNQGLQEIAAIQEAYDELLNKHKRRLQRSKINITPFEDFGYQIEESKYNLDGDGILATSIEEAGTVVLPMFFTPGAPLGDNLAELPEIVAQENLNLVPQNGVYPPIPTSIHATTPIDIFANASMAIGHENLLPDIDGTIRRIAPVIQYGNSFYPSFGIQLVREFLNLERDAFAWNPDTGYELRKANIPIDEEAMSYLLFSGPAGTFKNHPALDVLTGGLQDNAFENKIVIIGLTATGSANGSTFVTPGGDRMTGLEIWATHLENILNQRTIQRPVWAGMAEWGMVGLAALIVLLLPFVRAKISIPLALVVLIAMVSASFFMFTSKGMWFSPTYGLILLISGFAVLTGRRLIFTEHKKELVEAEGLETNKMLGLSFQGQGMLDLAFEKFSKCPLDKNMMDLLYNLGLDMERKRMYTKAAAVYEHIGTVDSNYKDIQKKIEMLKKAGEGAVFGGVGKKSADSTVMVEGLGQNATLGRYEVIKELGRGAMGIVYLGKDPKINRSVAIKTLQFDDDITDDQMKSIKERFFREAESAGNLTHPNIIRIFDAGEDQDVAYIAMELLEGKDLKDRTQKENLYSIVETIEIVHKMADALDYAHKQGVVHRDIKPANIMELNDKTLRITDFGIARIQASSKTATGAVLGTPAYMSPEQINGKKVDGRSDIFSLGVTFFELMTGEKPFHADSIAALLYRIANVAHPDPREFNKDIPEYVIPVLNKALAKTAEKRYQTAGEMAADLKDCLRKMGGKAPAAEPTPAPEPAAEKPAEPVATPAPTPAPEPPKTEVVEPEQPKSEPPKMEVVSEEAKPSDDFYNELQETFAVKEGESNNEDASEGTEISEPQLEVIQDEPAEDKTEIIQPDEIKEEPKEEISEVAPEEEKPEDKTEVLMPEKEAPKKSALKEDEIDWESTIVLPPEDNESSGEKSA